MRGNSRGGLRGTRAETALVLDLQLHQALGPADAIQIASGTICDFNLRL